MNGYILDPRRQNTRKSDFDPANCLEIQIQAKNWFIFRQDIY